MLKDIVEAKVVGPHQLRLRFEDGAEGVVDIAKVTKFTGLHEALRDPTYFAQVKVNSEWGTVYWPNGADLDPDVLYSHVSGEPLPELEEQASPKPGN